MRGLDDRSRRFDFGRPVFVLMTLCMLSFNCLHIFAEDAEQATTPQDSTVEADPNNLYVTPQVNSDACYLAEHFDAGSISVFKSRWVKSETKKEGDIDEDIAKYDGEWGIEAAAENALNGDLGLVLKSKAKHHAVSAFLDRPFRFTSKSPLIVQYDVRFQEGMECGGAYIKLLSEVDSLDLKEFHDKTPYTIMFGPDKCGNDLKLHFIFRYESPKTKQIEEKHMTIDGTDSFKHIFSDKYSHLLTLQIEADSRFELSVDQKVIKSGSLLNDFKPSVIPPTEVDDPSDKKPEDWDDRAKIPDPEAKKPEDWDESEPEKIVDPEASKPVEWLDDEPSYIPDPHAEKPDDWDVDLDGEWEPPLIENPKCKPGCGEWKAPLITNPKFKGKWYAPQIDNPNFKGIWKPRKIPNPEHFDDPNPFQNLAAISAVGLELWSMSNNIMFDNFVITSDSEVASQFASETWLKKKSKERMGFSNSDSVIDFLYKSANQNPWLWIVYALALILPITCCASYILSKPKPRKKRNQQPKTTQSSSGQTEKEEHEQASTATSCQAAGASSRDQLEACEEEQDEGQQDGEQGRDDGANATNGERANKSDLETAEEVEVDEGEEAEDEEENDDEEEEDDDVTNEENAEDEDDDAESIESGGQDEPSSQREDSKEVDETEPLHSEQGATTTIEEPSQPRKRRSRKD